MATLTSSNTYLIALEAQLASVRKRGDDFIIRFRVVVRNNGDYGQKFRRVIRVPVHDLNSRSILQTANRSSHGRSPHILSKILTRLSPVNDQCSSGRPAIAAALNLWC